jgi:Domain of unknown function (DUF1735)/Domain of unknown function (DUF4361)
MKSKLMFFISFLLLAGMIFISSCKEDFIHGDIIPNTDRVIVEFTNAESNNNSVSMEYSSDWVTIDLTELQFNTRSKVNNAVRVKFVTSPTVVADYNSANGTNYVSPPGGSYSFESNEITLSPAERNKSIRLRIKPSAITGGSYALGLAIAETSEGEISQTANNIFIILQVKNAYEGNYKASGQRILYNGSTVSSGVASIFPINRVKYAYTIDNNTIEIEVADLAGAYMYLQIDPSNNHVTVLPSSTSPTFFPMNNNGTCVYDPFTRTFSLNYLYFNASGFLREIQENLVAQ